MVEVFDKSKFYGITVDNYQLLINQLSKYDYGVDTIVLHIRCECNKEYIYKTIQDIPSVNITCECGNSIIKYGDIE